MKIYTRHESRWDAEAQRYVTLCDESFEYDGPVALCSSGGGGSSQPTQTTVQNVNIPDYARPYYETLMGQTQAITDINQNPYQPYSGDQVAGFSPLQQGAFNQLEGMQLPGQTTDASNMAYNTYGQAQQYQNYNPQQFQNQYYSPGFQSMGIGMQSVSGPQVSAAQGSYNPSLQNFYGSASQNNLMGNPGAQVGTGQWIDPGMAQAYMSPFVQQALQPTMQQMQRDSDLRQQQMNSQATQAGAYGGYRQALQLAEEQRNTQKSMGDVFSQGMQSAFNQANQAYNTDQARALQAAMANQGVGVQGVLANQQAQQQMALANQQAGLGVQQLGAGIGSQFAMQNLANQQAANLANQQTNMQGQLANQQAYQQMQQLGLQQLSNQNAFNQQNAANYAQYGLATQQADEASRQFGANLGLQGLQTQLSSANMLGNLGQQQYGQQLGLNQAQQMAGAQQQNYVQQLLNTDYQNYLNQQNWAYKNLGFMSDVLGRPLQQTSTSLYQAPPTAQQSLLGLGLGAYGLSGLMGTGKKAGGVIGFKKGGRVKHFVLGGGVMGQMKDQDLMRIANSKPPTMQSLAAAQELQNRGLLRKAAPVSPQATLPPQQEQAPGLPQLPAPNMNGVVQAAKGGVIGYAGRTGSLVGDPEIDWVDMQGGSSTPATGYLPYPDLTERLLKMSPAERQAAQGRSFNALTGLATLPMAGAATMLRSVGAFPNGIMTVARGAPSISPGVAAAGVPAGVAAATAAIPLSMATAPPTNEEIRATELRRMRQAEMAGYPSKAAAPGEEADGAGSGEDGSRGGSTSKGPAGAAAQKREGAARAASGKSILNEGLGGLKAPEIDKPEDYETGLANALKGVKSFETPEEKQLIAEMAAQRKKASDQRDQQYDKMGYMAALAGGIGALNATPRGGSGFQRFSSALGAAGASAMPYIEKREENLAKAEEKETQLAIDQGKLQVALAQGNKRDAIAAYKSWQDSKEKYDAVRMQLYGHELDYNSRIQSAMIAAQAHVAAANAGKSSLEDIKLMTLGNNLYKEAYKQSLSDVTMRAKQGNPLAVLDVDRDPKLKQQVVDGAVAYLRNNPFASQISKKLGMPIEVFPAFEGIHTQQPQLLNAPPAGATVLQ